MSFDERSSRYFLRLFNSNCNAVNNGDIDSGIYKICCASIVGMGCMKKQRWRFTKKIFCKYCNSEIKSKKESRRKFRYCDVECGLNDLLEN